MNIHVKLSYTVCSYVHGSGDKHLDMVDMMHSERMGME